MIDIDTMFGNFANFGFVKSRVPDDLFNKLKDEIYNLDKETAEVINNNLAGNIEQEYRLEKNKKELEEFLIRECHNYTANWDITRTARDLRTDDLELYNYWVNIQYKHEFNPIHSHDGLYSFVLWIDVPYTIAQEVAQDFCKNSNAPRPGMFSFFYTNIFGEIREAEFHVDQSHNGYAFIFPSCLQHMVYPFSSTDKPRISISGNLRRKCQT